eukprot:jgi/Chlat1/3709/Chrsp251S00806
MEPGQVVQCSMAGHAGQPGRVALQLLERQTGIASTSAGRCQNTARLRPGNTPAAQATHCKLHLASLSALPGLHDLKHDLKRARRKRDRVQRAWGHTGVVSSATVQQQQQAQQQQQQAKPQTHRLAYELFPGALVRWSVQDPASGVAPPTAVLVHGILGKGRNWASFARRLAQAFPSWQFLCVDLRCHGESAARSYAAPHTVESAARDVLQLVAELRLIPRMLVGHSFGGKVLSSFFQLRLLPTVVLSMVDQAKKPLSRPVQVWVLDATPGEVRFGPDGEDSPERLIRVLRGFPMPVANRSVLVDYLTQHGFSQGIAQWMTTNLRQHGVNGDQTFRWAFNLEAIADMLESYKTIDLWPVVENLPAGVHLSFVRAERSMHRWAGGDHTRIEWASMDAGDLKGNSLNIHMLHDAGHWVHTDNPDGLFHIIEPSFHL